jgi:hypothetical protein
MKFAINALIAMMAVDVARAIPVDIPNPNQNQRVQPGTAASTAPTASLGAPSKDKTIKMLKQGLKADQDRANKVMRNGVQMADLIYEYMRARYNHRLLTGELKAIVGGSAIGAGIFVTAAAAASALTFGLAAVVAGVVGAAFGAVGFVQGGIALRFKVPYNTIKENLKRAVQYRLDNRPAPQTRSTFGRWMNSYSRSKVSKEKLLVERDLRTIDFKYPLGDVASIKALIQFCMKHQLDPAEVKWFQKKLGEIVPYEQKVKAEAARAEAEAARNRPRGGSGAAASGLGGLLMF